MVQLPHGRIKVLATEKLENSQHSIIKSWCHKLKLKFQNPRTLKMRTVEVKN